MEPMCLAGSNECVDNAVGLYLFPYALCASLVSLMTFYPYCKSVCIGLAHHHPCLEGMKLVYTMSACLAGSSGALAPSRCAANVCICKKLHRQLYQVFLCFHKTLMHDFSQFYGHRTMRHLFLLIFKSCKRGKYCLFLCVGQ